MKKIDELSILCGIEACAIMFIPEDPRPEIWPSELGVQTVFSKFRGLSEIEQNRRKLNQESFLSKSIIKGKEQLKKMRDEHRKIEMSLHMSQYFINGGNVFGNASMIDLNDIAILTNQNLDEIKGKINMKRAQEVTPLLENGGETMTQGEQALVNHFLGPMNNVDFRQNPNGSMDIINGDSGSKMLTMGDVNVHSGWLKSFIR